MSSVSEADPAHPSPEGMEEERGFKIDSSDEVKGGQREIEEPLRRFKDIIRVSAREFAGVVCEYKKIDILADQVQSKIKKQLMKIPLVKINGYEAGILCGSFEGGETTIIIKNLEVYKSPINEVYIILGPPFTVHCPSIRGLETAMIQAMTNLVCRSDEVSRYLFNGAVESYNCINRLLFKNQNLLESIREISEKRSKGYSSSLRSNPFKSSTLIDPANPISIEDVLSTMKD